MYIAGGFGGAAALLLDVLGIDDLRWAPDQDFPAHRHDAGLDMVLTELSAYRGRKQDDGLDDDERLVLARSHRPGDIAAMVARAVTRLVARA